MLRRAAVAVFLVLSLLGQGTLAFAGTTGGISGYVRDSAGAPVVDATVNAVSPSGVASTHSDATGHFAILSLSPDTYTLTASKGDDTGRPLPGQVVFADQIVTAVVVLDPKLKEIARVTSRAASTNLVKGGLTADQYSVDATTVAKAAPLGGGGNLDSAYSAIASVPGVNVPIGGMGWNSNSVYIRGSQSFFSGFEFDGVPVNRAFDNYNSSTESSLGLQEVQVYTGGGPAGNSSSGTAGFINQVIKTGTYPGFAEVSGGLGDPTYYHEAKVEAGGATPDRNFSYYVGLSGYNQDFRFLNAQNGANMMGPGGLYGSYASSTNGVSFGDVGLCNSATPGNLNPAGFNALPWVTTDGIGNACLTQYSGDYDQTSMIADRENIVNLHFGIPRKNGLRDDLQLLWSASAMNTQFATSADDAGGVGLYTLAATGSGYCAPTPGPNPPSYCGGGTTGNPYAPNYPYYIDNTVYNIPFGTPIAGHSTQSYYQPSSPQDREFNAPLPNDLNDTIWNDTGIVKAQYTHELSDRAYLRFFGYTFFSDWTQAGAQAAWDSYVNFGGPESADAANYDLITHTTGGELQFADQFNATNLVQLTANYTGANVSRFNNDGYTNYAANFAPIGSPIGYISKKNGVYSCWDPVSGTQDPGGCAEGNSYQSDAITGPTGTAPPGSPAALAGAQWASLWNGDASGSYNTIKPKFSFLSLTDEFRPNDKLLFNLGLRYESYVYDLTPSNTPQTEFYSQIIANDTCQNTTNNSLLTSPLLPGQPPPAPLIYTVTCPSGYQHPNFTATSPTSYSMNYWSPRVSATYTQSPDTVWRASAGRFTEPPISASVQYLSASGDETAVWGATLPIGFNSPFHPIPGQTSAQYDFSLERHIRGTDWSFKITPFFNQTNGYQEQSFIGPGFVTQVPVGQFRSYGVEGALSKGDFNRDGLSGQLSLTYTKAQVQYQPYYGQNQMADVDSAISAFNALTSACAPGGADVGKKQYGLPLCSSSAGIAASRCYTPNNPAATPVEVTAPDPTCAIATSIANPYYSMAPQGLVNPGGWFPGADTGLSVSDNPTTSYYDAPWIGTLLLNYRVHKLAVTPSVQFVTGSSYGGPLDMIGVDPRECASNSLTSGITAVSPGTNPKQCDYLSAVANGFSASGAAPYLYIPNLQTGSFAQPGEFRNPSLLTGNMTLSYDVTPRITAQLTMADIFRTCFGGSKEPWTAAYAPGPNICGYAPNGLSTYVSNFYNGTSAKDVAANGISPQNWQLQSYAPTTGSDAGSIPPPFNVYFQIQVKL